MKFIVLLVIALIVNTKVIEKSVSLAAFQRGFGWFYFTKMALSAGTSTINLTTTIHGNPTTTLQEIQLSIVEDTEWEQQLRLKCDRKPMYSYNHTLQKSIATQSGFEINIDKEHLYYFILRDCKNRLTKGYTNMHMLIDIRLIVMNNQSHMGDEDDHWVIFVLVFVAAVWIIKRLKQQRSWLEQKNHIQKALYAGIITKIIALSFKTIDYLSYMALGKQSFICQLFYMTFYSVSQTIIIAVLIFIAFGWTINFSTAEDFDIFVPLACMVGMIKLVINVIGLFGQDSHEKYHMFDNIPGIITIVLRIMVYFVFLAGIIYSCKSFLSRSKNFFLLFFILASLYILSLPIMIFLAGNISKIKQQQFVFIGVQLIQIMTNCVLTYMTTSKKSLYQKIAFQSQTFDERKIF